MGKNLKSLTIEQASKLPKPPHFKNKDCTLIDLTTPLYTIFTIKGKKYARCNFD